MSLGTVTSHEGFPAKHRDLNYPPRHPLCRFPIKRQKQEVVGNHRNHTIVQNRRSGQSLSRIRRHSLISLSSLTGALRSRSLLIIVASVAQFTYLFFCSLTRHLVPSSVTGFPLVPLSPRFFFCFCHLARQRIKPIFSLHRHILESLQLYFRFFLTALLGIGSPTLRVPCDGGRLWFRCIGTVCLYQNRLAIFSDSVRPEIRRSSRSNNGLRV